MQVYLVIITTALVLTQIIRLIQNTMQLKHLKRKHDIEEDILPMYQEIRDCLWTIDERLSERWSSYND
jgi:low affinity Fe/Cu permease